MQIRFDPIQRRKILAALKQVSEEVERKASLAALRAAADVIVASARRDALLVDDPRTPNNISENIVRSYSRRHFRRTGNQMYRVGILGGARKQPGEDRSKFDANPGKDTFYWRFVNFGFTHVRSGRDIPGKHFFGKQLAKNADKAVQVFADRMQRELDKAVRRARKP